jgi:hypothetical protein
MGRRADDGGVTELIAIILILVVGPLAVRYGVDSRR